jgi:predicted nucleotidyltransferase
MKEIEIIPHMVRKHFPEVQAIYLFGTHGTEDERPESDMDIALLLPPVKAKEAGSLALSDAWSDLESVLGKTVDLINLRLAPTVLQKEVIAADRRIYTGDENAAGEFEMLVISFYQKLNEERAEIIGEVRTGGRFLHHE